MTDNKKEIDQISGVETTGHEWDGLKELNNPAPRWWLWVFYVSVIWSIGYWILYPAWPTLSGATKGTLGTNQYKDLSASQAQIAERQSVWLEKFKAADFETVQKDDSLYQFALAGGAAAFKDNCATCHGTGAAGGKGYPNLNDDDWLWGGTVDDIHQTLVYGIRSNHDEARVSAMPAFGKDGLMKKEEIENTVAYVLALNPNQDKTIDPNSSVYRQGEALFQQNCASCHGENGEGDRAFGAPNLTDAIWLYGGDRESLYKQIYAPNHGVMPFWAGRLDEQTLRQLAVYVHALGGGEKTAETVPENVAPEVTGPDDTVPEPIE